MSHNAQPPDVRFDDMRLSVAVVARVVNDLYADDQELVDLCFWLHGYCLKVRYVWKKVLPKKGFAHELVLKVWKGKATDAELKEFKRLARAFRDETSPKGNDFDNAPVAKTSVAKTIWQQLDIGLEHSRRGNPYILIFIGDAGIGKTTIFTAHAEMNNHGRSCYYRARSGGGLKLMISDIAKLNNGDHTQNHARVLAQVHESFWSSRQLLVDEAHLLIAEKSDKQPKIETLRGLADICRCSVVLAFTEDNFESGLANTGYNIRQLAWRGRFIRLPKFSELKESVQDSDIKALLKFYCPDLKATEDLLTALKAVGTHDMGGFGGIANVIKDALIEADVNKTELDEELILTSVAAQYHPGRPADAGKGIKGIAAGSKEATLNVLNVKRGRRRR